MLQGGRDGPSPAAAAAAGVPTPAGPGTPLPERWCQTRVVGSNLIPAVTVTASVLYLGCLLDLLDRLGIPGKPPLEEDPQVLVCHVRPRRKAFPLEREYHNE